VFLHTDWFIILLSGDRTKMVGGSLQRTWSSIFRRSVDVPPPLSMGTRGKGWGKGGPKRGKRSRRARQQEEKEEEHQKEEDQLHEEYVPPSPEEASGGGRRGRRRMTQQVVTLVVPFGSEVAHDSQICRYLFRDDHWLNPVANGK
jgi:hypothetical protein